MAETVSDTVRLTKAQIDALKLCAKEPQKRGFFSGWGPHHYGYGAQRIDIREATANKLLSLGLVERRDVEDAPRESTIRITPAGLAALESNSHE
jgi:hypothetical protein